MKKACFSIDKTHAFSGRKWQKSAYFVKTLYFYLIIHHPKLLSLHCKRFQMSSARSVKKNAFLGNFPIFSSIYLSKKCLSTSFRSCQELAKNEKNSQAAACEFSLVIRLGLALGSIGDAFVAKRRKNPWVRATSGNKKERPVASLCDPLGARTQDPNIKSVVLYQLS